MTSISRRLTTTAFLVAALSGSILAAASRADAQPPCTCEVAPPSFERPIITTFAGQALFSDLIQATPIPLPRPAQAIVERFGRIARLIVASHDPSTVWALPIPIPKPARQREKAAAKRDAALRQVDRLAGDIAMAEAKGLLDAAGASAMSSLIDDLRSQIETLPIPIP